MDTLQIFPIVYGDLTFTEVYNLLNESLGLCRYPVMKAAALNHLNAKQEHTAYQREIFLKVGHFHCKNCDVPFHGTFQQNHIWPPNVFYH